MSKSEIFEVLYNFEAEGPEELSVSAGTRVQKLRT